ncbi:MAG: hypothetical protein ACPGJS_09320 [Flammeovirgaceae bacterium]
MDRLLSTLYPNEYIPVRAGGRNGDMKNDGYCYASRIFFQAHATRGESTKQTKDKITSDLNGCLQNWKNVKKFIYITNDTLIGEVENYVDTLRAKFPKIKIETWGHKRLTSEIKKLEIKEIEFIIDRRIIPEVTFSESDVISTKFLITCEFNFIKELSENDLSGFPFENPLLFENSILKFLRNLIKGQQYRHTEIEKFIDIDREQYNIQYPDAIRFPEKENEYQFFYHRRIPSYEELKSTIKKDKVSQFLLNNGVSKEKISEILTCYGDGCGDNTSFKELYRLRPLYIQFLVIKNISKFPIRLTELESILHSGVLYKTSVLDEANFTSLPEFIIETSQNIIIPLGLFLGQFQGLSKLTQGIVTSTYVSEQIQYLELGSIQESQGIEFIGPRLVPKKINFEYLNQKLISSIHDFSFERVYWIDRHWQFGSCPHLFLVNNGELKYQGEIFNVKPNQMQKEKIIIPFFVSELIIAELEQEITFISSIKKKWR